jgi:hypothetical protein
LYRFQVCPTGTGVAAGVGVKLDVGVGVAVRVGAGAGAFPELLPQPKTAIVIATARIACATLRKDVRDIWLVATSGSITFFASARWERGTGPAGFPPLCNFSAPCSIENRTLEIDAFSDRILRPCYLAFRLAEICYALRAVQRKNWSRLFDSQTTLLVALHRSQRQVADRSRPVRRSQANWISFVMPPRDRLRSF